MSLANYRSSRAQTGETAGARQQAGAYVNLTKFLPVADGLNAREIDKIHIKQTVQYQDEKVYIIC